MGSPYSSQSPSGYNANPPPDDGSTGSTNKITWAGIKTKLGDPLNTFASAVDTAITTAFGKTIDGAGVASTAVDYAAGAADQGKLIRVTVSGKTVTTPDATSVKSPFTFAVLNNSTGSITLAGFGGTQTIDGQTTQSLAFGAGVFLFTDGSNWYSSGFNLGTVTNLTTGFAMLNGTLTAAVALSALTIAIKGHDGNDPSASNPVYVIVRNATAATGDYTLMGLTAATSLVISSGSTMGATNSTAFKLWLVGFNDGGTFRIGAINTLSGTNVYPLSPWSIASSTAEGGAGAADSAQVFYTGTAVTSKSYGLIGYMTWETGLTTAGTWNATPTRIQLYGTGVPLPGATVQQQYNATGAVNTGTTLIPDDDTIPQITEGDEYITQAITPSSATNILHIQANLHLSHTVDAIPSVALFQDATANALSVGRSRIPTTSVLAEVSVRHQMLAATSSATTFRARGGFAQGATTTFNGQGGARKYGGVLNSYIMVTEIMS